jgi:hypothetical protein
MRDWLSENQKPQIGREYDGKTSQSDESDLGHMVLLFRFEGCAHASISSQRTKALRDR